MYKKMKQKEGKKSVIRLTLPYEYKKHLDLLEKIYNQKTYSKTLMHIIDLDIHRFWLTDSENKKS